MMSFRYRARTEDGTLVHGVVEAYDEFEAVAQIKRECPIVERIIPVKPSKPHRIDLNEPLWVPDSSLALVANQFGIMLRAGLPMARVVGLIAEQTSDRLMKRILTECASDVSAGYSLSQSLEKNGKKIPVTFIETVKAGEESGTLELCFARLEQYYTKAHKVKRKVRSAMTYPLFLLVIAVVVVIVVMVKLVPSMLGMISTIGGQLPLPTRMLLGISGFFQHYWPYVFVGMAGIAIAYRLYGKTQKGGMKLARLKLRLPVIGRISTMNAASQFANTMCTLLAAGLPMARVLAITGRVVDNLAVGDSLSRAVMALEEGRSLGEILRNNPYLPPMLVEMTAVGEASGMMEETMDTIGTYYDQEAEAASNRALSMLEPIITVIMGVMIGFLVIAIYVPMFTMETTVV